MCYVDACTGALWNYEMKKQLAKISSFFSLTLLIEGLISLVLFLTHNWIFAVWNDKPSFYELILIISIFCGWIPSLISSVVGVIFSWATPPKKIFILSIAACFLSFFWGLFVIISIVKQL